MEKITYSVDPHNRLICRKTGRASRVKRYRLILDGRFKTHEGNLLTYHVKKSRHSGIPQQIKFSGDYSLNRNNDLVFTLNKWNNQVEGNKLVIKSQLMDAKDDELSFIVATRDLAGNSRAYVLKLFGAWQADKHNRLSFEAAKGGGSRDNLRLRGAWKVNRNNEIAYTRTRSHLKRRKKTAGNITFKGYWAMTERYRISYILNKKIGSRFDFKAAVIRPSKKGLECRIGIGVSAAKKTLTLCGKWKLNRKLGLSLQVPYENGKARNITFSVRRALGETSEAFMRALKKRKDVSLLAGMSFRW